MAGAAGAGSGAGYRNPLPKIIGRATVSDLKIMGENDNNHDDDDDKKEKKSEANEVANKDFIKLGDLVSRYIVSWFSRGEAPYPATRGYIRIPVPMRIVMGKNVTQKNTEPLAKWIGWKADWYRYLCTLSRGDSVYMTVRDINTRVADYGCLSVVQALGCSNFLEKNQIIRKIDCWLCMRTRNHCACRLPSRRSQARRCSTRRSPAC